MSFPRLSNSPHYPHPNKRLKYALRRYWTSKQKIDNPFLHLSIPFSLSLEGPIARLLMCAPAAQPTKISQNGCFHLIPLISSSSALFRPIERPKLLFHQSLSHSFPCNGGGRVSVARPLATRRSPRATVNPVFATHPKNRQLTSLFATHPKTGSRKSLVCHTYDTPGALYLFLTNSGRARLPHRGQAELLVFFRESRIASHQWFHCMRGCAVPQLVLNDRSARKQSRFFRCLRKRRTAGSASARRRARQAVDP